MRAYTLSTHLYVTVFVIGIFKLLKENLEHCACGEQEGRVEFDVAPPPRRSVVVHSVKTKSQPEK